MSGEAEQLLSEIRDCCVEMLQLTKAEATRQAQMREQYAVAVASQRRFQRVGFAILFVGVGILAYVFLMR